MAAYYLPNGPKFFNDLNSPAPLAASSAPTPAAPPTPAAGAESDDDLIDDYDKK